MKRENLEERETEVARYERGRELIGESEIEEGNKGDCQMIKRGI